MKALFFGVLTAALMPVALPLPAYAQEEGDNTFPQVAPEQTLISLSATERTKLKQDTLTASLKYELEGGSANEIQDKINTAMAKALESARGIEGATVSTGSYFVYMFDRADTIDPRTGKPMASKKLWRGSQSMTIEGKDATAILNAVGKIQELGLTMDNLNYNLSPEAAEAVRDDLMTKALAKIRTRADLAAKALGKSSVDIQQVTVDGASQPYPQPRMYMKAEMAMASDAGVAAPVAEAGESDITLTVTARILLKP